MSEVISFVIGAAPPPRLDKALGRDVPDDASLSRSRLAKLIADGAVRVDKIQRAGKKPMAAEVALQGLTLGARLD